MAAAIVTVSYRRHGSGRVAVIDWTSADDGSATATVHLDGIIHKCVTNPGATAPTANYDITLVDEDGFDIAQSLLLNRHTSSTEEVYPFKQVTLTGTGSDAGAVPVFHAGPVTFTLAAAGDTKLGQLKVYMR